MPGRERGGRGRGPEEGRAGGKQSRKDRDKDKGKDREGDKDREDEHVKGGKKAAKVSPAARIPHL